MVKDLTISTLHPRKTQARWTPPFQRIPAWEVRFWKAFIVASICAYPCWVLYHLPDYRGGVGPHVMYIRKQQREAAKAEKAAQES